MLTFYLDFCSVIFHELDLFVLARMNDDGANVFEMYCISSITHRASINSGNESAIVIGMMDGN